jgi:hypothetical protein
MFNFLQMHLKCVTSVGKMLSNEITLQQTSAHLEYLFVQTQICQSENLFKMKLLWVTGYQIQVWLLTFLATVTNTQWIICCFLQRTVHGCICITCKDHTFVTQNLLRLIKLRIPFTFNTHRCMSTHTHTHTHTHIHKSPLHHHAHRNLWWIKILAEHTISFSRRTMLHYIHEWPTSQSDGVQGVHNTRVQVWNGNILSAKKYVTDTSAHVSELTDVTSLTM